jgi:hypothetical protein
MFCIFCEAVADNTFEFENEGTKYAGVAVCRVCVDTLLARGFQPGWEEKLTRVSTNEPVVAGLTGAQAVGVALSVVMEKSTMDECQKEAGGIVEHLQRMGFGLFPLGQKESPAEEKPGVVDNEGWVKYGKTWSEFCDSKLNQPGTLVVVPDGEELLIGDVNENGGCCEHCPGIHSRVVILRYAVLCWARDLGRPEELPPSGARKDLPGLESQGRTPGQAAQNRGPEAWKMRKTR